MKIVVDTNIIVSGLFFKSEYPNQLLSNIMFVNSDLECLINDEIKAEYLRLFERNRNSSNYNPVVIEHFISKLHLIESTSNYNVIVEDQTDNKFINCAADGKALYIISGDKHILTHLDEIKILTNVDVIKVKDFCETYLKNNTQGV